MKPLVPLPFPASTHRRGFSLVELLGVLAVVAILAAALVPVLLRYLESVASQAEGEALNRLSKGVMTYVQNSRRVPAATEFSTNLASTLGWEVGDVALNGRRMPRAFLPDPLCRLGANAVLPYSQSFTNGSTTLTNARVLIISSLGRGLPSVITNGVNTNGVMFAQIWGAAEGQQPTGWTYGGDWNEIKVQRISLSPLFVRLALNNNTVGQTGRYAIDTTNHVALPSPGFTLTNNFLKGSVLYLYGADGALQTREVLQDEDLSYFYDKGIWRRKALTITSLRRGGADLQAAYDIFMSNPGNPNAKFGVTKMQVTSDMYNYMSNYVYWATNSFAAAKKAPVSASQTALKNDSYNYLFKAGAP